MTEETNADLSLTERMELIASSLGKVGFSGSVDVIREGIKEIENLKSALFEIEFLGGDPDFFDEEISAICRKALGDDLFADFKGQAETLRSELSAMADKVQEVDERNKALEEALKLARDSHGTTLLTDPPQDAWKANGVDQVIEEALKGDYS